MERHFSERVDLVLQTVGFFDDVQEIVFFELHVFHHLLEAGNAALVDLLVGLNLDLGGHIQVALQLDDVFFQEAGVVQEFLESFNYICQLRLRTNVHKAREL